MDWQYQVLRSFIRVEIVFEAFSFILYDVQTMKQKSKVVFKSPPGGKVKHFRVN